MSKREEMLAVASFPAYLFSEHPAGCVVDKLGSDRKPANQYLITREGEQCTCLGYVKWKKCKHLKIYNGDFEFCGAGVMAEYAKEEADRLIGLLASSFADAAEWSLDLERIPSYVQALQLQIASDSPEGLKLCFWLHTFPDRLKMGVNLRFSK
jgi:hypothetical protein